MSKSANHHDFGGKSSSIAACDYDDVSGKMIIHFHNGGTYHYPDCPKSEYEALKKAASVGSHFHQRIRKYKGVKVT